MPCTSRAAPRSQRACSKSNECWPEERTPQVGSQRVHRFRHEQPIGRIVADRGRARWSAGEDTESSARRCLPRQASASSTHPAQSGLQQNTEEGRTFGSRSRRRSIDSSKLNAPALADRTVLSMAGQEPLPGNAGNDAGKYPSRWRHIRWCRRGSGERRRFGRDRSLPNQSASRPFGDSCFRIRVSSSVPLDWPCSHFRPAVNVVWLERGLC